MHWLPLFRLVTLGASAVFAIIVLGLCAHILNVTLSFTGLYFVFAALGVATALLTVITVVPMLIIEVLRKGAFTSFVVVEAVWLSILWILWLATGAETANTSSLVGFSQGSCSDWDPIDARACREFAGVEAFSFLSWILLMAYTITIVVEGFLLASRGKTWTASVAELGVLASTAPTTTAAENTTTTYPMQQQPQTYPVQPQQQQQQQAYPQQGYAPQGYPQQGYAASPAPTGTTTISSGVQYTGGAPQQGHYPQV
ncbi:hypothetical protein PUNSTDRAFT_119274 [Punctularia strigosozonata HHB-11173 SS5]|uniref:uncharacterized protein n=1 Tax=Punctularia strigosozonata (strain HHB-11173) TaxID=741275 RepID=UPI0004416E23|nr:uncharacterized protein PUNSTDRAFT_119274 [Punctularia strigosozonata HHB-11173 SS5]EIN10222.1 hypothetical protein PUNSTDRAFT_119274 [Punctularia strigosozonata HHB-11173 SS5]